MLKKSRLVLGCAWMLALSAVTVADEPPGQQLLQTIRTDSQQTEAAIARGEERSRLCSYCHGDRGTSKRDYIPNLAGQNPVYLIGQFENFRSGDRRSYVMKQVAEGLSDTEKVDLALYYAQQQPSLEFSVNGEVETGELIYRATCQACHGNDGSGQQQIPRIASQPQTYLLNTLQAVINDEHTRSIPEMQAVVSQMSEQELQNVTAWLATRSL